MKYLLLSTFCLLLITTVVIGQTCSDGVCNGNENCRTCPSDCRCASTPLHSSDVLTFYWVTFEGDYSTANKNTALKTCSGVTLATVSYEYANKIRMEGTGKLLDGRVLNLADCACNNGFSCFMQLDATKFPWGVGSNNNAILPYTSIASNDLPQGKILYVPAFDGWVLPGTNGKIHNGCVRVDDIGWSFGGTHIDFFVGREGHYETLINQYPTSRVAIYDGGCSLVTNYMTGTVTSPPPPPPPPASPSVVTKVITAAADSHVRGGTYGATNYGTSPKLELKYSPNVSFYRDFYLRFDLSSLRTYGSVINATLVLNVASIDVENDIPLNFTVLSSNSWSESTITYNNRPTAGTLTVANFTRKKLSMTLNVNFSQSVKNVLAGTNNLLSIKVSRNRGTEEILGFHSRQSTTTSLRPNLKVFANAN